MTTDPVCPVFACVHAYSIVTIAGPNPHLLDNKGCMAWWQKQHHLFPLYMCCATRTTTLLACYLNPFHNNSCGLYTNYTWCVHGLSLHIIMTCVYRLHHALSVLFFFLPLNRYGSSHLFQDCRLWLFWSIYYTWHKWTMLWAGFLIIYYIRKWRLPTVPR